MSASKGSEANTKARLLSASFEYFRAGGDYRHRLLQKLKSEIPKQTTHGLSPQPPREDKRS